MILEYLNIINSKKIILASQSPRRKSILEQIGIKFEINPSEFEEKDGLEKDQFESPIEYVKHNSKGKVFDIAEHVQDAELIIACDSVVVFGDEILEKAKDDRDASNMLHKLSGKTHSIISVVSLLFPKILIDGKPLLRVFEDKTEVTLCELTDGFIEKYIEGRYGFGKAGGYGIQDFAGPSIVKRIEGCYWNSVGFPSFKFCEHLVEIGKEHWF